MTPDIPGRLSGQSQQDSPPGIITQEDREAFRRHAEEQAQESFGYGERAFREGRLADALFWLERAHRLAPDSPNVSCVLAAVRSASGHYDAAICLLEALNRRYDFLQGRLMLASACLAAGRSEQAADVLIQALSRYVCQDSVAPLADAVAAAAGWSGWCAMTGPETLLLNDGAGHAVVLADGKPVRTTRKGRILRLHLPENQAIRDVRVTIAGAEPAGSPVALFRSRVSEGFVESGPHGLQGWVWHPFDPARAPDIRIHKKSSEQIFRCAVPCAAGSAELPLACFWQIDIPLSDLPPGELHVSGSDGRALRGSPLNVRLEREAAEWAVRRASGHQGKTHEIPAFLPVCVSPSIPERRSAASVPKRRNTLVVVPVWGNTEGVRACLESLRISLSGRAPGREKTEILVVDDASPDPATLRMLNGFAKAGEISLLRLRRNRGFPGAVNAGLARAAGRDVVLLNSDTLLPQGWLGGLRDVAYSDAAYGTVTPLSNEATIFSYPDLHENPEPDLVQTNHLAALARKACAGEAVEVPTAHGFCMFIRHDCLQDTGVLREDLFAQGYGEENDFCLRARVLGWKHVAAPGVFVTHAGSESFGPGASGAALRARNLGILNRLHPGYDELIRSFSDADPLFYARRRVDEARWQDVLNRIRPKRGSSGKGRLVLLITHDQGGGVERVVRSRAAELAERGMIPVLIRPVQGGCKVVPWSEEKTEPGYFSLRYTLPDEQERLLALFDRRSVAFIEIHHLSGHHRSIRRLARDLDVPVEIWLHDYAVFCPRITLTGVTGRYCGEPDVSACETCVKVLGARTDMEEEGVAGHIRASAAMLSGARRVVVPSEDMAWRIARHFPGLVTQTVPLEDDRTDLCLQRLALLQQTMFPARPDVVGLPRTDRLRVCVIGAIGHEKGYDVLLDLGRDAARRGLPLEYVVAGYTPDDRTLTETGHIFVTGPYKQDEAEAFVRAQQADIAFLPSVWPETWSFVLGVAWRAGLQVAAFDLGAITQRIKAAGRGFVISPAIPVEELNMLLMSLCERSYEDRV
ncbi:glycosyltransferase [Acetobacter sp. AN02]|uniref:glycosyltransferase n=1 Tax=Acetobacter sp. AN02 TaxID=2894186 RepID=UPI0024340F1C|nr:glycosyltransferase [Acetobacter sp. AN02]MDG6094028.1 glycosyltransferase [Acetobacter sp. AN02]